MSGNFVPATRAPAMAVDEIEEDNPPATKQQKLIKAGLLGVLVAIVIYVVLDYTASTINSVICILVV